MALPMASPLQDEPQDLVFFHIKKQYFLSQKLGKDEVRPEWHLPVVLACFLGSGIYFRSCAPDGTVRTLLA